MLRESSTKTRLAVCRKRTRTGRALSKRRAIEILKEQRSHARERNEYECEYEGRKYGSHDFELGASAGCGGDSAADAVLQVYGSLRIRLHLHESGSGALGPHRFRRGGADFRGAAADAAVYVARLGAGAGRDGG